MGTIKIIKGDNSTIITDYKNKSYVFELLAEVHTIFIISIKFVYTI